MRINVSKEFTVPPSYFVAIAIAIAIDATDSCACALLLILYIYILISFYSHRIDFKLRLQLMLLLLFLFSYLDLIIVSMCIFFVHEYSCVFPFTVRFMKLVTAIDSKWTMLETCNGLALISIEIFTLSYQLPKRIANLFLLLSFFATALAYWILPIQHNMNDTSEMNCILFGW